MKLSLTVIASAAVVLGQTTKAAPASSSSSKAKASERGVKVRFIRAAQPLGGTAGIPSGSTFGISDIKEIRKSGAASNQHILLRIAIKARPATTIDLDKVLVQVFWYDERLHDAAPLLADASVDYKWVGGAPIWIKNNPEILEAARFRDEPHPTRRHLGYITRVYYHGKLQDERREPRQLSPVTPPAVPKNP